MTQDEHHELLDRVKAAPRVAFCLADADLIRRIKAERSQCHENSRKYVDVHPGSEVVEGWVIAPVDLIYKHSIVRTADGVLLCVSPRNEGEEAGVFVHHDARWGDFAACDNRLSDLRGADWRMILE